MCFLVKANQILSKSKINNKEIKKYIVNKTSFKKVYLMKFFMDTGLAKEILMKIGD